MGFLAAFAISANAQKISETLCNTIFNSVNFSIKPSKVYRRYILSDVCDFEFEVVTKAKVLLSIEEHDNAETSRKAFIEGAKNVYGEERPKADLRSASSVKYWDDIGLFLSKKKFDSYLLLRKSQFTIQVFSDDREILVRIEKLLRDISFAPNRRAETPMALVTQKEFALTSSEAFAVPSDVLAQPK